MMHRVRSGLSAALLGLLVAVALAAAGWAHRLPAIAAGGVPADLAAYLATGGALDDLCGTVPGEAAQRDHCPVCSLPGALPGPAAAQEARRLARPAGMAAPAVASVPRAACHPGWSGRAPPVV
jgi:hypothetical protein